MKRFIVKVLGFFFLVALLLYYRFFPFGPVIEGKYLFFVFWLSLFLLFKIGGKISVIFGLFFLLLSSLLLFFNHQGVALRVVVYAYYFLVIGACFEFISLLRKKEEHHRS